MALTDADKRSIAGIIAAEVEQLRGEAQQSARPGRAGPGRAGPGRAGRGRAGRGQGVGAQAVGAQDVQALDAAVSPLAATLGSWKLAGAGSTQDEALQATAQDAPVDLDGVDNAMYAGGRVMVTTFGGQTRQQIRGDAGTLQAGDKFSGIMVLAFDTENNQYVELYADDQGKVSFSTTQQWETDGQTLRLFHDDYVAEYTASGATSLLFNLYETAPGDAAAGAYGNGYGNPVKSTVLTRK